MLATLLALREDITLTVDSGAFTAYKLGKKIELEGYMNFLATSKLNIEHYMSLDVIGDVQESKKNYYKMLDEGFKPMPVFTRGAPTSDLEEYYETSDVVAIGGLVKTKGRLEYVDEVMKIVRGRKVHWLGIVDIETIKKHRPYSCDSSAHSSGRRFGRCLVYTGYGMMEKLEQGDMEKLKELSSAIRRLGYKPSDLLNPSSWRGGTDVNACQWITAKSYALLSRDVFENLGTREYLAISERKDLSHLMQELKNDEKNSNNFEWRA